jgi:oligosaccharide repeat unit polymerase
MFIPVVVLVASLMPLPGSSLPFLLFGTVAVAFVTLRFNRAFDLLNPVRVFGVLWCFCLSVASLKLDTAISNWNSQMYAYVSLALLMFILGFAGAALLSKSGGALIPGGADLLPAVEFLRTRRTFVVATICILAGVSALGYEYYLLGGITILAADPNAARARLFGIASLGGDAALDTLSIKVVHVVSELCKYGIYLATILLLQKGLTRKQKIGASVLIVIALLPYTAQGGRQFIYEPFVVALALYHYLRRPLTAHQLMALGLVILLVVSAAGYARSVSSQEKIVSQQIDRWSLLPQGLFWDILSSGYHSITTPFEVFYRLTQDLPNSRASGIGGYLFYVFHRMVPRQNLQELTLRFYGGELITPTFLGEFYADYGTSGVILGPFVLGLAFGYIYRRALRYDSLYWLALYALYVEKLTYFPYVNIFSQYYDWLFDILFLAVLIALCQSKTFALTSRRPPNDKNRIPIEGVQVTAYEV